MLPDPTPPEPPVLPQTPLYPSLTTNLPHPIMAFRDFSFPPSTPLYPPASTVLEYLNAYAKAFGVAKHIQLNTEVESIQFVRPADEKEGKWNIITRNTGTDATQDHLGVDTLILANGRHNLPHFPSATTNPETSPGPTPQLPGLTQWLESGHASHAMYYRSPLEEYRGRIVLVVGDGPSARDIAPEIASVAKQVWRSIRKYALPKLEAHELGDSTNVSNRLTQSSSMNDELPIRICSPIASLGSPGGTSSKEREPNVFLIDGNALVVDYVVFATGYELSFPFFSDDVLERHDDDFHQDSDILKRNRFDAPLSLYPQSLSPLLYHLLPSSPRLALGSLFVLGLPRPVIPFPLVQAQCHLLTATLQGRSQLQQLLQSKYGDKERGTFDGGNIDPRTTTRPQILSRSYHLFTSPYNQFDYRELLIELSLPFTDESAIQVETEYMVPKWQRRVREKNDALRETWRDLERRGRAEETVRNVGSGKGGEAEWVELMEGLVKL